MPTLWSTLVEWPNSANFLREATEKPGHELLGPGFSSLTGISNGLPGGESVYEHPVDSHTRSEVSHNDAFH